ncbi:MAG: protein translocase subunit SecD [Candidatus Glassbacteria bacterium]
MFSSLKFKIILTVAVIIGSLYYLWPTFYLSRMSPEKRRTMHLSDPQGLRELEERSIKLGLDLQGGMHLVLELDKSQMSMSADEEKDAIDRALEIIRTRVDQFGVSEPLIQKAGDERIIVELAGVIDTARARALVEQSAYLEFKLCKPQQQFLDILSRVDELIGEQNLYVVTEKKEGSGGTPSLAPADSEKKESFDPLKLFGENEAADSAAAVKAPADSAAKDSGAVKAAGQDTSGLEELLGTSGAAAQSEKRPFGKLFFQAPWGQDTRRESELLVPVNNVPLVREYLNMPQIKQAVELAEVDNTVDYLPYRSQDEGDEPDTLEVLWGDDDTDYIGQDGTAYKRVFLMKKRPEMTGGYLANASATLGSGYDPKVANKPLVLMEMTGEGTDSFATISERFINRDLAIVLDKIVKFAPRIITRIPSGRAQIEGVPSMEKARDLAIVLRAGALPAPLQIAESRTIGPSLGADSIQSGKLSALIGLSLVVLFMLVYYKFGGLVANFARVLEMIITLAVLAGFNATLTLPGIAGLILTIGMAVDANVLIFERIREELRSGKTLRAAIDAGYDRAFSAILDGNLTTFLAAIVLFQFGTGPIKGFAVTLSIGLATSMFTAIYVTRVIFELWTQRKSVKSISL